MNKPYSLVFRLVFQIISLLMCE